MLGPRRKPLDLLRLFIPTFSLRLGKNQLRERSSLLLFGQSTGELPAKQAGSHLGLRNWDTMLIARTSPANRRQLAAARGFTLLEIMIVVGVIGIMASIALPNFLKARATAEQRSCIKNLRELDVTKQQWGFENKQGPTATPTIAQIQAYFGQSRMPVCPSRGTYRLRRLDRNPTCTRATVGHTL